MDAHKHRIAASRAAGDFLEALRRNDLIAATNAFRVVQFSFPAMLQALIADAEGQESATTRTEESKG